MKTVATIEARMASSRLPGKILLPILGRPMLELLIERVKQSKKIEEIIIATTTDPSDDILVKKSRDWQVGIYRGSTNDVLDRVLTAAKKYQADVIVELTGDCPLLDPEIIDEAIETFQRSKVDYVANITLGAPFPRGLDVQVFPTPILARLAKETTDPFDREHVSLYIYSHPEKFRLKKIAPSFLNKFQNLRLTVDTEKDLELVRRIYHLLYFKKRFFTTSDILSLFKRFPNLAMINQEVSQKPARYDAKVLRKIKKEEMEGRYLFRPKYKAAIIGCGKMGSLFDNDPKRTSVASHAGAYNTHAEIKLIAASDINPSALKDFGQRWDVEHLYTNYQELLAKEKPDIVSVTTKNDMHYQVVRDAIIGQAKAIFCEKPFTDNPAKAAELVRLSRERNVSLVINYNRRFDQMHRSAVKEAKLLATPLSGVIYYVNGFINNGCHAIDLVQMFMGKIEMIQAISKSTTPEGDPNISVILTLKNGAEIFLKGLSETTYYLFEADFLYEKGRIRLLDRGETSELFTPKIDDTITSIKSLYPKSKKINALFDHLPKAIDNIVSSIEGRERNLSPATNALSILEIMAGAYLSIQNGGKKVRLPLPKNNYALSSKVVSQ